MTETRKIQQQQKIIIQSIFIHDLYIYTHHYFFLFFFADISVIITMEGTAIHFHGRCSVKKVNAVKSNPQENQLKEKHQVTDDH